MQHSLKKNTLKTDGKHLYIFDMAKSIVGMQI